MSAMPHAERLREVRRRIDEAARRAGRDPADVTLVAVSKYASVEAVRALYDAGQRDFAEHRAQGLAEKMDALPADARWHFTGALQSNKLKELRARRPLVHSFDRADLAARWGEAPVLVQVDFSGLAQRSGVPPDEAPALVDALAAAGVPVVGLATLPPQDGEPRRWFRALRGIRDALQARHPDLRHLSMGMSADFEEAVEEGATMVRVGRALFEP